MIVSSVDLGMIVVPSIVEAIRIYDNKGIELPALLRHYKSAKPVTGEDFTAIVNAYSHEHGLNEYFENIIKDALK